MSFKVMHRKLRNNQGVYLIELMVALVISGLLAVVLGDSIAKTIQINTRTEKGVIAPLIAENLIERLRATPFANWPDSGSTIQINIDPTDNTVIQTPVARARALMLDGQTLKYLTGTSGSLLPNYKFNGAATVQYSQNASGTLRTVSILVTWSDSSSQSVQNYQQNGQICLYGIHREQ